MLLNILKKNIVFLSIFSLLALSSSSIFAMRQNGSVSSDKSEEYAELSRAHPQMQAVGYVLAPYGVGSGTLVDKRLSTMKYYEDKTPESSDVALTCAHNFGPFLDLRKEELLQKQEKEAKFMSFNLEKEEFFMGFDDSCDLENPQDRVRILEVFLPCQYIADYFKHGSTSSVSYNFDFAFVKLEKEMADRPALFIAYQPFASEGSLKDFIGMGYGNEKREKRAAPFYNATSLPWFIKSNLIFSEDVLCEPGDSGGPALVSISERNDLFIAGIIVAGGQVDDDNIKLFKQTVPQDGEEETDLYSAILPLPSMQATLKSLETKEVFGRMFEAAGGQIFSIMDNMIAFLKQRAALKSSNS